MIRTVENSLSFLWVTATVPQCLDSQLLEGVLYNFYHGVRLHRNKYTEELYRVGL